MKQELDLLTELGRIHQKTLTEHNDKIRWMLLKMQEMAIIINRHESYIQEKEGNKCHIGN